MIDLLHDNQDQAAYRRLKGTINQTYPPGRYVAISGGQIVADSDRFAELDSLLKAQGRDPTKVLVVQAGVEYPENETIFSPMVPL